MYNAAVGVKRDIPYPNNQLPKKRIQYAHTKKNRSARKLYCKNPHPGIPIPNIRIKIAWIPRGNCGIWRNNFVLSFRRFSLSFRCFALGVGSLILSLVRLILPLVRLTCLFFGRYLESVKALDFLLWLILVGSMAFNLLDNYSLKRKELK